MVGPHLNLRLNLMRNLLIFTKMVNGDEGNDDKFLAGSLGGGFMGRSPRQPMR
jgi:hypothetical protein